MSTKIRALIAATALVLLAAVGAFATTTPANVTGSNISDVIANVVHGAAQASKAVILDTNGAVDIVRTASLRIGTSGSETTVGATAAELNNIADVSAYTQAILVAGAITATGAVRHVTISGASGAYAITLAAPTVAGTPLCIQYLTGSTNAITLSLANVIGGTAATTASFDAADETLCFISTTTKWMVVGQTGVTLSLLEVPTDSVLAMWATDRWPAFALAA